MNEKQKLIDDMNSIAEQFNGHCECEEWDEAQAAARAITNICRRLELLKIQEAV